MGTSNRQTVAVLVGVSLLIGWLALAPQRVFAQDGGEPAPPAETPSEQPTPQAEPPAPTPEPGEQEGPPEETEPAPLPEPPPPPDPPSIGDLVRVRLNSGTTVDGVLRDFSIARAIVEVAGVDLTIATRDIDTMEKRLSPVDEFKRLRRLVPDFDIKRRLELVKWARDRELYEIALTEIYDLLARSPELTDAREEMLILERLIELRDAPRPQRDPDQPARDPLDPESPADEAWKAFAKGEFPVLTEGQINLVKVFEVDLSDLDCKIIITPDTISEFMREYGDRDIIPDTRAGREAFRRLPDEQILDAMFRLQAREYYHHVKVVGHPGPMEKFRQNMNWIARGCASTACHGGKTGGRFIIRRDALNSDDTIYTNFVIMSQFELRDGTPLINWDEPELSPLLQYAMGRKDALLRHPEVKGWRAIYRDRDSRMFQRGVEWINSMYRPRPLYDLGYTPPGEVLGGPKGEPTPEEVER